MQLLNRHVERVIMDCFNMHEALGRDCACTQ
eukprot:COSAG02_NODE_38759_length_425_cov_0.938650_2_plen_30_part_01